MSGVAAPALSIDQLAPLLAKAYRLTVRDPRWLEGEYDRNLRLSDDAARIGLSKSVMAPQRRPWCGRRRC